MNTPHGRKQTVKWDRIRFHFNESLPTLCVDFPFYSIRTTITCSAGIHKVMLVIILVIAQEGTASEREEKCMGFKNVPKLSSCFPMLLVVRYHVSKALRDKDSEWLWARSSVCGKFLAMKLNVNCRILRPDNQSDVYKVGETSFGILGNCYAINLTC